ncbi:hypothetical protein CFP71_39545 [Amycolatopsis thailandensis]|uniref:Uncharacterized protein n=1 Tax=Amycolatopsis thailandensis TaxID=589330 RepID=A0A229RE79_9PSEU|nr:hypothetical protein [Amycolatopsis thailandensis]OXM44947.1 hypothetical protein CFP71_39545 [Amycolatopsis thailandensis]
MVDQPTNDDGKPKPVHIDEIRKRAAEQGDLSSEEAADRAQKAISGLLDQVTKPLQETAKSITDLATGRLPKLSVPPVEDLSFVKSFRDAEASRTAQLEAIREAQRVQMDVIYEAQQQERERQDQLEAERVEREKENLQVAKDSRSHAKTAITIAILSLIVAILALAAGIVVPLIAG